MAICNPIPPRHLPGRYRYPNQGENKCGKWKGNAVVALNQIGGYIGLPLHPLLFNKFIQFLQTHGFHNGQTHFEIIRMNGSGWYQSVSLLQSFIQSINGTDIVPPGLPLVTGGIPPDLVGEHFGDQFSLLKLFNGKLVTYLGNIAVILEIHVHPRFNLTVKVFGFKPDGFRFFTYCSSKSSLTLLAPGITWSLRKKKQSDNEVAEII